MSDIHPENLLEKFAAGGLTPYEHNLLQEHLAACVACRFELVVRADLEIEADALEFDRVAQPSSTAPASTAPASTAQLAALLAGRGSAAQLEALRALAHVRGDAPHSLAGSGGAPGDREPDSSTELPTVVAPVPIRRRSWRRVLAITGAALGLASGAAALVGTQLPKSSSYVLDVTRALGTHGAADQSRPPARSVPSKPAEPREAAEPAAESDPDPKAREAAASPAAKQAPAPLHERPTSAPNRAASRARADEALTAAQLFSEANQARRASDSVRATQLYRLLQRKFPGSQEAHLSLVTLGSLQLNSGNAAGALATFNRYLSRGGGRALEAEALYGQAQALRRLGRIGEERRVWERLLARHPGSGYAPQARERLDSLGGS